MGVPTQVALTVENLRQIAQLLVEEGEHADTEKPDRRLIMAATEQVAVNYWREFPEGVKWLEKVLENCSDAKTEKDLESKIVLPSWLKAREPLSRGERAGRARRSAGPRSE